MSQQLKLYVGFDPREIAAYLVAVGSLFKYGAPMCATPRGLLLNDLQRRGLYTRPTERRNGMLYDPISEHSMSTEFAISRFLVPQLAQKGWALFTDCDVMARRSIKGLSELANPQYAVMCVKHKHNPVEGIKMDGQVQSIYNRKNWSSVCLWNCDHPANKKLTPEFVNSVPGRDLHAFSWLRDEEIGELPAEYNYLVGETTGVADPIIVHFTSGIPHMRGYEDCQYADEWRAQLDHLTPDLLMALGALPG